MYTEVIADALRMQFGFDVTPEDAKLEFGIEEEDDQCFFVEITAQEDPEGSTFVRTRFFFMENPDYLIDLCSNPDHTNELFLLQSVIRYGRLQVLKQDDGAIAPFLQYTERFAFEAPQEIELTEGMTYEEEMEKFKETIGTWYLYTFILLHREAVTSFQVIKSISKGEKIHPEIGKLFGDSPNEGCGGQFLM